MKDYEWICPKDIHIDQEVQRTFDKRHADRIGAAFDPDLFGLGHVSLREDGKFYVLDGQHRITAAVNAGKGDVPQLFRVYRGLSKPEEAAKFCELQERRKAPNALDVFRLQVKSGSAMHCDVERIVESFGLVIAAHVRGGGISAVVTLLQIYQTKIGVKPIEQTMPSTGLPKGQLLSRTLNVIKAAWGKDRDAYDGVLLRGVAAMLHKHGPSLDAQRLAKSMAKSCNPAQAIGSIRTIQSMANKGSVLSAVEWLEGKYFRGRSKASAPNDGSAQ